MNYFIKTISLIFIQLAQVDDAMKNCTNDAEKASLENLKCDLHELLDLTRETLREQIQPKTEDANEDNGIDEEDDGNENYVPDGVNDNENYGKSGTDRNGQGTSESSDPLANELALFMSEIQAFESSPESRETNKSISSQLEKFEKVRVSLQNRIIKDHR